MKQFQFLAFFIIALILKTTLQLKSVKKIKSINDLISRSEGIETKRADIEELNENENASHIQAESETNVESAAKTEIPTDKSFPPQQRSMIMQGWMTIRSETFKSTRRFPELKIADTSQILKYTNNFQRINSQFNKNNKEIPSKISFFFRLTPAYIYYTFNKKEMILADAISIKNVIDLKWMEEENQKCIRIIEENQDKWDICGKEEKSMEKWFCKIKTVAGLGLEEECNPKESTLDNKKVAIKTVTQPLIIIPLPSKQCNAEWNYNKHGTDWECMCTDGKEQSPINLPPASMAVNTDLLPLFEYEFVKPVISENCTSANLKEGEKNGIRYEENALRIKHPKFGKIVTLDGAVYIAQEIVFHTPSEHQVDGITYDMEMQVIHHGKSIGDISKRVILSFFFRAKPGVFNKFIDKLNFFELPNPTETYKELSDTLYIPHVLLNSDEDDLAVMIPFSYYTYQGSLTSPPCSEETIHFIASEAIDLSTTALELFKEALRIPDRKDSSGNFIISNSTINNNRKLQPLNGRTVFHYDHTKYNYPEYRKKCSKSLNIQTGHYEKRVKETAEYIFVNGNKPSGIPNSFVVTEEEAKGLIV